MIHKTYEVVCQMPPEVASKTLEALLLKENVKYTVSSLILTSVRTPIAVLGIQPKLYSHSNWFGINPFTFISGIDITFESENKRSTSVLVRVNRLRAFLWLMFWITCSFFAALAMPEPGGAIFFIGVASAAWLGIVRFLSGYLLMKEIRDSLQIPANRG